MNLWEAIKARIAKLFEREALFSFSCLIVAAVALFTDKMDAQTWGWASAIFCGISTAGLVVRKATEKPQDPPGPPPDAVVQ